MSIKIWEKVNKYSSKIQLHFKQITIILQSEFNHVAIIIPSKKKPSQSNKNTVQDTDQSAVSKTQLLSKFNKSVNTRTKTNFQKGMKN